MNEVGIIASAANIGAGGGGAPEPVTFNGVAVTFNGQPVTFAGA